MVEVYLVRHGKTQGNKEKRFIGCRTDSPLCKEGQEELLKRSYVEVEKIYASPMLRCRQTSCLAFFEECPELIPELKECDFGKLEGHCHEELKGCSFYEQFVKAGGALPYPDGESLAGFQKRCVEGFCRCVNKSIQQQEKTVGMVIHGGTIMAIMSWLLKTPNDFYSYYVDNADGYHLTIDPKLWQKGAHQDALVYWTTHGIYS